MFAGEAAAKLEFSPSDTIAATAPLPSGNNPIIVTQWVKNISGGNIIVKWNVAGYNGETGWDYKICTPDSCFDFPPPISFPEISLVDGDSVMLEWKVIPNASTGTGFCTCNFWVKGDSAQSNVRNFLKVDATHLSSIAAQHIQPSVVVFPNPATSVLNIETNNEFDELTVINQLGETVLKSPQTNQINVSLLPKGIYYCTLVKRNKVVSVKEFQR